MDISNKEEFSEKVEGIVNKLRLANKLVEDTSSAYHDVSSEVRYLDREVSKLKREIEEIEEEIGDDIKVNALLGEVSKEKKQMVATSLSEIATYALQKIKGEDYSVKIEIDTENKTKAKILVCTTYIDDEGNAKVMENDPFEDRGGGIADMVATSIFFAANEILDSKTLFILTDEPGKNISEEYVLLFANFVRALGERFGKQVILSTHNKKIGNSLGDNVIEIYKDDDNISRARKITQQGDD